MCVCSAGVCKSAEEGDDRRLFPVEGGGEERLCSGEGAVKAGKVAALVPWRQLLGFRPVFEYTYPYPKFSILI